MEITRRTASSNKKAHILLVDNKQDDWGLVAFALAEYSVIATRNFAEGLWHARQRYFDLYILDNWLPDGFGVELCRLIREFDPHTPILLYSACAYGDDIEEARNAGAQAYLIKPVTSNELRRTVNGLISSARAAVYDAKRAEMAAIKVELQNRQLQNRRRMEAASKSHLRAALRVRAMRAYLAAGGTRGDFARLWVSLRSQELR